MWEEAYAVTELITVCVKCRLQFLFFSESLGCISIARGIQSREKEGQATQGLREACRARLALCVECTRGGDLASRSGVKIWREDFV